jgi:hypothetical protein
MENRPEQTEMSQMTEVTTFRNNAGEAFGRGSYANNQSSSNIMDASTTRTNNTTRNHREISAVISSNRKVIGERSYLTQHGGHEGRMEIDNHADTHVAGSNCTVLQFTGRVCSVSPFTEHYKALYDIKIASVATTWDDPFTGETTMLIFHEALWFGHNTYELYDSLINPNQCRAYGISICDNPFDPTRPLGLHDPKLKS